MGIFSKKWWTHSHPRARGGVDYGDHGPSLPGGRFIRPIQGHEVDGQTGEDLGPTYNIKTPEGLAEFNRRAKERGVSDFYQIIKRSKER